MDIRKTLPAAILMGGLAASQLSGADGCTPQQHVVKNGETLSAIAAAERGDWRLYPLIAKASGISNPNLINVGQTLTIPCPSAADVALLCGPPATIRKRAITAKAAPPVEPPAPAPVAASASAPAPTITVNPIITNTVNVASAAPAVVAESKHTAATVPPPATVPVPSATPTPVPAATPAPTSNVVVAKVNTARFVGSMWTSAITTPLERSNVIDYSHLDFAWVAKSFGGGKWQIQPYISVNATVAQKDYPWDNLVRGTGGVRLVKSFKNGLVSVNGGYAAEARKGMGTKSAPAYYTEGWFGWSQPTTTKSHRLFMAAPGSTWFYFGRITPFEGNNLIGLAKLEQGVTVAKLGKLSIIPDGWGTIGWDTKKEFWNNRYSYGGGLKLATSWKQIAFDLTGGYECATQYRGPSASACGPTVKVNLWRGIRKGGE